VDFDVVFNKILSLKNESMDWGPGPTKRGQNSKTCPHYDVTSRKPEIQSEKVFVFQFQLEDVLNP